MLNALLSEAIYGRGGQGMTYQEIICWHSEAKEAHKLY
jgi:hypothetical protein